MPKFEIVSHFSPKGDQPQAIHELSKGVKHGIAKQTLYGVTGSGKTYTMASVIKNTQLPTLIIAHNKTLAAQLYTEFKEIFPKNAVEYFVSYYDFYRPEAYVPTSDLYIEKDSRINEQIDRMRHSATQSLLERRDTLIIASVSCIYGIGSSETYLQMALRFQKGEHISRQKLLHLLVKLQYTRNDINFHRGTFRVRGDTVEIFPPHEEERAIRIEFWDDEIEAISIIEPFKGESITSLERIGIYPNTHYAIPEEQRKKAVSSIKKELKITLERFQEKGRVLEQQRLEDRTLRDLEMLEQLGFCHGVENYSRHFSNRKEGEAPPCLLDYFPKDFLLLIDESHATIPQIRAMYKGDQARKKNLVDHGFRLPSALDNRPLKFKEFEEKINQIIFISATPGPYEIENSQKVAEQIIRPTGLIDPGNRNQASKGTNR